MGHMRRSGRPTGGLTTLAVAAPRLRRALLGIRSTKGSTCACPQQTGRSRTRRVRVGSGWSSFSRSARSPRWARSRWTCSSRRSPPRLAISRSSPRQSCSPSLPTCSVSRSARRSARSAMSSGGDARFSSAFPSSPSPRSSAQRPSRSRSWRARGSSRGLPPQSASSSRGRSSATSTPVRTSRVTTRR